MSSVENSPSRVKVEKMDLWNSLEGDSTLNLDIEAWNEGDSIKTLLEGDWDKDEDGKDPATRAQALIDHLDHLVKLEGYVSTEQEWYEGDEKSGLFLGCLDGMVPGSATYSWEQPTPPESPPIPPQVDSAEYLQTYTELNELLNGKPTEPVYSYQYPDGTVVNQTFDGYVSSSPDYNSTSSSCTGSSSPGYSSDSNTSSDNSSDPDWFTSQRSPQPHKKIQKSVTTATDDRKLRKKEQNKNAATRYRMKKKQQHQEILGEEKGLLDTNTELKEKVTDLKREMKYLKSLLRDVYKAKGLIK